MHKSRRRIHERLWAGDGHAIEDASGVLTYTDIRACVARMAGELHAAGIGPGSAVVVALPRSADAVVALFAVWAADAVAICVDPAWSVERITDIAGRARASAVMADEDLSAELAGRGLASWLVRDRHLAQNHRTAGEGPGPFAPSLDAAYVIFTSGTTAEPKGVAVSHRSFGNYLDWRNRSLAIDPGLRVAAIASTGADAMLRELVWPLTAGGCVVPLTDEDRDDAARLIAALRRHRVAAVHTLPSVLDILLDEPGFRDLPDLRIVHASSERLRWSTVRRFQQTCSAALHHSYGQAETAVSVTFFDCADAGEMTGVFVPVGRPVDNVTIKVLQDGVPVGPGGVGELYIGGTSVGLGYLDDDRATANAFIRASDGERLYRSGDLGAVNPDGTLQFHGRTDGQLEVNGYRVAPGEIEAAAISHSGVREAVVVADGDGNLLAVIQRSLGSSIEVSELEASMARMLPPYMRARIEIVDTIPRTSAGKVDRQAVSDSRRRTGVPAGGPLTSDRDQRIREFILQAWQEVIPSDDIQDDDDFFEIGGTSIHAMRIATQLRKVLGLSVGAGMVFDYPTVREMTAVISERTSSA